MNHHNAYLLLKDYDAQTYRVPHNGRIEDCAFQDNTQLEWISIPGTVRDIGDWAFSGCSNLKTVGLNPGLKTIGESAFSQTHLQEISLPDTLDYLGDGCFEDTMLETVTIPGGVRNIYANAFRCNLYLHTVHLMEGVQRICNGAFAWCCHLQEICMPDSLEIIEPYAFEDSAPIARIRASRRWLQEHPEYVHWIRNPL